MKRLNDNEEQQAQSMACTHLVRGCEDAVSDLVLATGEAGEPPAIRERAHDILAEVLSSWQEASEALRPADLPEAGVTVANNLDGWTTDELFAEAVGRRADDAPALRLMQDTLLRAFLTAHDGAIGSTAQGQPILA
jgi:hypothetical protein